MPHDLPPWYTVYQQSQRWFKAGVFEAIVDDLRALLRLSQGRQEQPSGIVIDSRTLQSTPESGGRAGYDGGKRKKGSKVHIAVNTLGHLLELLVTPANEQDRAQVQELAQQVQEITGETVEIAFVDQGYTGEQAAQDAAAEGIQLEVVSEEGVRALASPLGGRAKFCLGSSIGTIGRLRAFSPNMGWFASGCFCHPDAETVCGVTSSKCITPSSINHLLKVRE